jgi:2-haloacid dehalogenase
MPSNPNSSKAIVFDLGGVLIDWDPRHMYREVFDDEAEMDRFLTEIATLEWNSHHDAGRRWEDGVALLSAEYPEYAGLISLYWERWEDMLNGPITETVDILAELKAAGREVHALTNWSAQSFPIARERFEFLDWFENIVVSGEEKLIKPDQQLYQILLDRIGRDASDCIFIDDGIRNVNAAAEMGFDAIHFTSPEQLHEQLSDRGLLSD